MRRVCGWGSALVVALALAAVAPARAARLEYRGLVLPGHQVERMAGAALEAPGDSARVTQLLGDLVAELQDLGYLEARARGAWRDDRLAIDVDEGRRARLTAIVLHAPAPADSEALAAAIGLLPGAWASPREIAAAIERALATVVDHGHPYAALGIRGWDRDSSGVRLELTGSLGPRVSISRVRFDGLHTTRASLAEKALGRFKGTSFNRAAAEAGRERLLQLGLFRQVAFAGLEGETDWALGQLVYKVDEPHYNRFEGAIGAQGEAGPVGLMRLDLGNLVGTGRAIGLNWESRGRGVVSFGARYAEPMVFGAPLRLEAAFDQNVQDTLYVRTHWGAQARVALSAQERLEAGYDEERVVQDRGVAGEAQLRSSSLALERNTIDQPLAPRRGFRLRIGAAQTNRTERSALSPTHGSHGGSLDLSGEIHRPTGPWTGLALEVAVRAKFSSDRVLPLYERYPLGGALTLRGFDEEAFRVDRLALSRLEWRWFLGATGQRLALFWDHAQASTRLPLDPTGDRTETLSRDGVGFGLRLEAAGSLIGLDYGLAAGRPPLEGKIHLQLVSTF